MASRTGTTVVPHQFTSRTITRTITVDTNPGPIRFTSVAPPPRPPLPKRPGQDNVEEKFVKLFMSLAGPDEEIDAFELQEILSHAYKKELGEWEKAEESITIVDNTDAIVELKLANNVNERTELWAGFLQRPCQHDGYMSGKLGCKEFMDLWISVRNWKNCFDTFDRDKSGDMNFSELGNALRGAGFTVSPTLTKALLRRYWNRREQIGFEDFIQIVARLRMLMDSFRSSPSSGGKITVTLDEYLSKCLVL